MNNKQAPASITKPELIHTNTKNSSLVINKTTLEASQSDAESSVSNSTAGEKCDHRLKIMASRHESAGPEKTSEFQTIKEKIEQQLMLNKIPAQKPIPPAKPFISKIPMSNFKLKATPQPAENNELKKASKDSLVEIRLNTDHSSNQSLISLSSSTSSLANNKAFNHILKTTESVAAKQKPAIAPKPKLIDLEFKNELERLFATSNSSFNKTKGQQNNTQAKPGQSKLIATVEENTNSDKLRNLFSLITGNLISDYSELLVDFRAETYADTCSNKLVSTLNPQNLLSQHTNALKLPDNDKLVQFLIQILVRSCRIFDVATTVENGRLSYWRYANPIIAAYRQNDNTGKIKSRTNSSSTQTTGDGHELEPYAVHCSDNNTTGTSITDKLTIIETGARNRRLNCSCAGSERQQNLADSIIDLLSDKMSISSSRISYKLKRVVSADSSRNEEENFCEYTCFSGSVSSDSNSEHDFFIDLYDEENLTTDTTDNTSMSMPQKRHEKSPYSSVHRPIHKLRKASRSASNYFRIIETNYPPAKNFYHKIYQHYNDNHNYKQRRLSRSFFMHSNSKSHRAQDETLRDAENLSDIDDGDIDQWADLNNNINNEGQPEAARFLKDNHIHHHQNHFKLDTQVEKIKLKRAYNKSPFLLLSRNSSNSTNKKHNKSTSRAKKKLSQIKFLTKSHTRKAKRRQESQRRVKKFANTSVFDQCLKQNRPTKSSSELETATTTTTTTSNRPEKKNLERCQDTRRKSYYHYQDRRKTREDKNTCSNFSNLISTTNNSSSLNHYCRNKNLFKAYKVVVKPKTTTATSRSSNKARIFRSEAKQNLTSLKKLVNLRHNIRFPLNIVTSTANMSSNTHTPTDPTSQVQRTNSVDSLEDQAAINDINLNSSMSEIRIQFEYSVNTGAAAAPSKAEAAVYSKADLKSDLKFDQDVIKQRTREGLKFWQKEEEKKKSVEGSSTTSSLGAVNNSKPATNKSLKTATVSSIPTSYFPMQRCNNNNNSSTNPDQADTDVSIKSASSRVKDRINVFETKVSEGNCTATSLGLRKPSYLAKPVVSTKKFPLIELKETTEIVTTLTRTETSEVETNLACFQAVDSASSGHKLARADTARLGLSRSVGSEINNVTRIPIHCSKAGQAKSITNLAKPKEQEKAPGSGSVSNEALNMVADIQSVNEVLLVNASQTSLGDEQRREEEEKMMVKSQVNLASAVSSSSSLEMDEMEIIIDLDAYNECRKIEAIDERLKNIVMHMIPTTRKAYVDDICEGIKSLLTGGDLEEIRSPIDLPNQVIKFVQKRYSSLLNEYEVEGAPDREPTAKECNEEEKEEQRVCPDLHSALEIQTAAPLQDTTTELTVVKEFQLNTPEQTDGDDDNYMKVEEDTLYIVEKKLACGNTYKIVPVVEAAPEAQPEPATDSTNTDVDREIRKNFELKSKTDEFYQTNVAGLLTALRLSSVSSQASTHHNDYQLHYLSSGSSPEAKTPCLVVFTDSATDRNQKFNLEKKYHKSIVETHALNEKKEINVVATLNVLFTGDARYFDSFSLINPPKTKQDIHSISVHKIFNNFPIGKYFAMIKYVSAESCLSKELLIDISLLPLQIRSNLIYAYEASLKTSQTYPSLYLMTLDIHLAQRERASLTNALFTARLEQFDDLPAHYKHAFLANRVDFLNKMRTESACSPVLDQFIKQVETDLNSFYLCERVIDTPETMRTATDLCRINRLDALAYFNSVQKNSELFGRVFAGTAETARPAMCLSTQTRVKETKLDDQIFQTHGNRFYIIENNKWFKCLVPITDLPAGQESRLHRTNDQLVKSVENLQHNSSLIIENANKRQNFIFSRHLMNVPPYKNFGSMANLIMNLHEQIRSVELPKEEQEDTVYEDEAPVPEFNTESDHSHQIHQLRHGSRSDISNSHIYNSVQTYDIPTEDTNQKGDFSELNDQVAQFQQETLNHNLKGAYSQEIRNLSEVEFASFETDRLKKNKSGASVPEHSRELVRDDVVVRDQIIIKEIDRMFTSIRDHQGSNAKAKGELKFVRQVKKRSGSWGYSSSKRHVKAKVMDMPYAEDYETIMKRVEMAEAGENCQLADEADEKVFVRIDDYLNREVSKALERSYSVDYLNQDAGQRTRIRYIRIPGHMIETIDRKKAVREKKAIEKEGDPKQQVTEYRSAPYDLRYWSILKLLEKEQQNGGRVDESAMPLKKIEGSEEEFLSMNELEKEIEKVNLSGVVGGVQPQEYLMNDSAPKYIIKEKTVKKAMLKKIDAELEKIEKEKETLATKIGKNKSFKSGFRIIDRLFGHRESKSSSQSSSSNESISGNLKRSSSSTVYGDKGSQIVNKAYSTQQMQYSGLDVLEGAYEQHQEKHHGSGKMTIVDRLTNLLPSSHLGHDRQSKKNY